MPTPPLRLKLMQETVERVEAKLREGYRPQGHPGSGFAAVRAASEQAVKDGWVNSVRAFSTRLEVSKTHGLIPDESLYRPRQYQHRSPGEPVIVDQSFMAEFDIEGEPEEVLVIGDSHDAPHLKDKSRFEWIGAYCAEHQIKRLHSTGDFMSMDCFSTHTDRATFEGISKPTFSQEMESFHEANGALQRGLAGWKPKKTCTLGNHEHRAWKYDNFHPDGLSHSHMVLEGFHQWGWRTCSYGEWMFIAGVGFTHVPFNRMGRGAAKAQRPNLAMVDTIHGDDHEATVMTAFKSGPFRAPKVYSAGTSLPPGFIEGYANKGGSTWESGVCRATLWGGRVLAWAFTDMHLLKRRYGQRLAAWGRREAWV